jgi:ArsR family transcriptional regulator, arsenate/arsenite/antimonite-responsive transcriptional repressor
MEPTPAAMFRALGHPGRLAVFDLIRSSSGTCCSPAASSICACEIAQQVGLSASVVSRHLRELRLSQLIRTEKRGQWVHCRVNAEALEALERFVAGSDARTRPWAS